MDDHGLKDLINTNHAFVLGKLKDLESQITPTYDDGVNNLVNTNHDFILAKNGGPRSTDGNSLFRSNDD